MKTWVRRSLNAGALTAGALLATGTAAHADTTLVSSDNTGILNGTQVYAPIQVPIDICGNAVALLGNAGAGCVGGATAVNEEWGWAHYQASTENTGILNGTQVAAPIQAPINACGNAAGVLGNAWAGCEGGATATHGKKHRHGRDCGCYGTHRRGESATTEALPVIGSLTSLTSGLPLIGGLTNELPVVGGLLGGGRSDSPGLASGLPVVGPLLGGLTGGSGLPGVGNLGGIGGGSGGSDFQTESTGGPTVVNGGTGGGNGHTPRPRPRPRPRPHDCDEHGRDYGHDRDVTMISSGNTGILNGTQVYAPIQIPVEVSGLAVGVLGNASAWSHGGSSAKLG